MRRPDGSDLMPTTFTFTGDVQTIVVPSGVSSAIIDIAGAGGSGCEDRSQEVSVSAGAVFTDGVMVEQTVDNGDGTGVRTLYDAQGNVTGTENLTGLPIPEPPPPSLEEVFADVPVATLEEANSVLAALQAALAARGVL